MNTKQEQYLSSLIERYAQLDSCKDSILQAFLMMKESYENGGKLLVAGNGGSAADAEHIVGELMKGFVLKREESKDLKDSLKSVDDKLGEYIGNNLQQSLPAIALVDHVALSTAFLNDVDPLLSFAQQLNGYGACGDVFFGISTSGNSKNVLYAMILAKAKGLKTILLTGKDGGCIKQYADCSIIVPENETYKIQEYHLPIYHCLCLMLEDAFFGQNE